MSARARGSGLGVALVALLLVPVVVAVVSSRNPTSIESAEIAQVGQAATYPTHTASTSEQTCNAKVSSLGLNSWNGISTPYHTTPGVPVLFVFDYQYDQADNTFFNLRDAAEMIYGPNDNFSSTGNNNGASSGTYGTLMFASSGALIGPTGLSPELMNFTLLGMTNFTGGNGTFPQQSRITIEVETANGSEWIAFRARNQLAGTSGVGQDPPQSGSAGRIGTLSCLTGNHQDIMVYDPNSTDLSPPEAPTSPAAGAYPVADGTGGCMALNWTAPTTGNPATGYSVFYTQDTGSHPTATPMNTSAYSYLKHVSGITTTACGLAHGATYDFRVVSTNANGEGGVSDDFSNVTVAGMPSFVAATAGLNTTVLVNWTINVATQKATGYDVFYRTSPEGSVALPLNVTGYAWAGHVADPTHQLNVTGLLVNMTYCFRVQSTNATAGGEGDVATTSACATTGLVPSAPVLSGVYVPCSTFALSWSLPSGTPEAYEVRRTSLDVSTANRSWLIPPWGNFSLRQLDDSPFTRINGTFAYSVRVREAGVWSPYGNEVSFTPPLVRTVGDCGLQWGGMDPATLAGMAHVSVSAFSLILSIVLIVIGAAIGYAALGSGGGAAVGTVAGVLASVSLSLVPTWAVMLVVALVLAGFVAASTAKRETRNARGRFR